MLAFLPLSAKSSLLRPSLSLRGVFHHCRTVRPSSLALPFAVWRLFVEAAAASPFRWRPKRKHKSMEQLIRRDLAEELLDLQDVCQSCGVCKRFGVWKQLLRAPQVLWLQLKRFNNALHPVRTPVELVKGAPFSLSTDDGTIHIYRLRGSILHSGTSLAGGDGHYRYLRRDEMERWWVYDDTTCQQVGEKETRALFDQLCYRSGGRKRSRGRRFERVFILPWTVWIWRGRRGQTRRLCVRSSHQSRRRRRWRVGTS